MSGWLLRKANNSSRCLGVSCFESFRISWENFVGRTTAAATTGPASGPRPASSTPATIFQPWRYARASNWNIGSRISRSRRGFFGHTRGVLAQSSAQIIKLRPADFARAFDLDLFGQRRMQREHAFDALAIGNTAHGESFVNAVAVP